MPPTHTSPPWIYYKSGQDCFVVRNAGLHGNGHLRTFSADAVDEMNARLACAAPDMLEALRAINYEIRNLEVPSIHAALDDAWNQVQKAIAKAEGEA